MICVDVTLYGNLENYKPGVWINIIFLEIGAELSCMERMVSSFLTDA